MVAELPLNMFPREIGSARCNRIEIESDNISSNSSEGMTFTESRI
jgi:hypothetical protein